MGGGGGQVPLTRAKKTCLAVSLRWIVLLHGKSTKSNQHGITESYWGVNSILYVTSTYLRIEFGNKNCEEKTCAGVDVFVDHVRIMMAGWRTSLGNLSHKIVVSVLIFRVLLLLLDLAELCSGFHKIKRGWLSRLVAPARKYQNFSFK
jgi:hypothetical protein